MKIKTLGHIFLANKLRSAILKTTPGRRAGGVRGGDEDCRYSNWSGYFCILVRFTQSCTSKKIRTKHAEAFFSTISNLGGTIKSILRCKSWKRRNPRPPGRGVRGGGEMEIQINGDPKEIAAFVVGLQERHKKEVSLPAVICQAVTEGEAVRLQGDRVGRSFQESG